MTFFDSTQKKLDQSIKTLGKAMSLKSYRRLALNFFILSVNLIIIILYFALSEAKIIIAPKSENLTRETAVAVAEEQILTKAVELNEPFPITEYETEKTQAEGEVVLYNATALRTQTLVENTQLINEAGEIIRLRETVKLSPGQTLAAAAYSPEKDKEVLPGRWQILKLPYLRDQIYGQVNESFASRENQVKFIGKEFYNSVFEKTIALLREQAAEQWRQEGKQISAGGEIAVALREIERDGEIGDRGKDFLNVKAKGLASLVVFDRQEILASAANEFLRALPPGKSWQEFLDEKTEIVPVPEEKVIIVKITGKIEDKINSSQISKEELVGKNREEIKQYLNSLFAGADIQVKFSPFWVRSVPNLQDHVDIEIRRD